MQSRNLGLAVSLGLLSAWAAGCGVQEPDELAQGGAWEPVAEVTTEQGLTTTTYQLSWAARTPNRNCRFGDTTLGHQPAENMRASGRLEEPISITGLADRRIISMRLRTPSTTPVSFKYDDVLLLNYGDRMLVASDRRAAAYSANVSSAVGLPLIRYSWANILDDDINNALKEPAWCAAGATSCSVPPTETQGTVDVNMPTFQSVDETTYPTAPNTRVFTLVTIGDNDDGTFNSGAQTQDLDCTHGRLDLTLEITSKPLRDDIIQYQGGGSGTTRLHVWLANSSGQFSTAGQAITDVGLSSANLAAPHRTGDFNGDGYDDVLRVENCGGLACFRIAYARPTGGAGCSGGPAGCFNPSIWASQANTWVIPYSNNFMVGDFNGDGRDDILHYQAGNNGTTRLHVWLANAIGQFPSAGQAWTDVNMSGANLDAPHRVGDFNGDGYDDVLRVESCGGLACFRIAYANPAGGAGCTGGPVGCFNASVWVGPTSNWGSGGLAITYSQNFLVGRSNNDKRDDIIQYQAGNNGTTRLHVWLADASGRFSATGQTWTDVNLSGANLGAPHRMGDFDGDGFDDLLRVEDCGGQACFRIAYASPSGSAGCTGGPAGCFNPSAWISQPNTWLVSYSNNFLVGNVD